MNNLPTVEELHSLGEYLDFRNSLHITELVYKYQDNVYSVFFVIGNDGIPPTVEINTWYQEGLKEI